MVTIHPSAVVEDGAELGENVSVGPFAYVGAGARIGDGTVLHPQAVVYGSVTMGRNCSVHSAAALGDLPQDLRFDGSEATVVEIGDHCIFREATTVHRATTKEDGITRIGNHCLFMATSHVGHDSKVGDNVILANSAMLGGHVHIGDRVILGGNAAVHQFVRIGRLCMVGGHAAVSKDIPPFCMHVSAQLNALSGINFVGLRRAGISVEDRSAIKAAYKTLYRSGYNVSDALAVLRNQPDNPVIREMIDFIAGSKRGICLSTRAERFNLLKEAAE